MNIQIPKLKEKLGISKVDKNSSLNNFDGPIMGPFAIQTSPKRVQP